MASDAKARLIKTTKAPVGAFVVLWWKTMDVYPLSP
jgi:hypothetical protein